MDSCTLSSTPALVGGGWSKLRPGAALPPGKRPGTLYIGGWVGPRTGLDGCGKYRPQCDLIPGPSSPRPVAIPFTQWKAINNKYCVLLSELSDIHIHQFAP